MQLVSRSLSSLLKQAIHYQMQIVSTVELIRLNQLIRLKSFEFFENICIYIHSLNQIFTVIKIFD